MAGNVPSYSDLFPVLPLGAAPQKTQGAWAPPKSKKVTKSFVVSGVERRTEQRTGKFGKKETETVFERVMQQTGTHIQTASDKERNLNILITGKESAVNKAWVILSKEIQQPVRETITIPEAHHRIIIGKGGATLKKIEADTGTRINITRETDEIVISGPASGFHKAKKMIEKLSHDEARRDRQVLEMLQCYHPLIAGHKNKDLIRIRKECDVQIHVPPPQAEKDEIVVAGDRDGVAAAVAQLTAIYEEKRRTCGELNAQIDKSKHRYIIGKKGKHLDQIMEEFGVVVEIPPADEDSNQIKFRGMNTNLVHALTRAYELANSMTTIKVPIPAAMHRHLIGRAGSNIKALKEGTECYVNFPKEGDEDPNLVTVEGSPKEVQIVRERMMNFAIESVPLEQKYHRLLIGQKGAKIKEIQKTMGEVKIDFPNQDADAKDANLITVRGERAVVNQAVQLLRAHIKVLLDENYVLEVPLHKSLHGNIIGKGGATVKKIKEDTNCRIDVPGQDEDTNIITVTGRQQDTPAAMAAIYAVRDSFMTHSEKFMFAKAKFTYLKGNVLSTLEKSCGVVSEVMQGDPTIVTVKGPENSVANCKAKLDGIAAILQAGGAMTTIKAPVKAHSSLIGRQGATQKEIEKASGAILIFPSIGNSKSEDVYVFGAKEAVDAAKKAVATRVGDIANQTDATMEVAKEYHGAILRQQAAFLNTLKAKFNVRVSMPKRGNKQSPTTVKLEGPKSTVPAAIKAIEEFVQDIKETVTVTCTIPSKHHRTIIGPKGATIRDLQETHNVNIKMPARPDPNRKPRAKKPAAGAGEDGGDKAAEDTAAPASGPADTIKVSGRQAKCDAAVAAMKLLIPVDEMIQIPVEQHRFLIGKGGENIRNMMTEHSVFVKFPNPKSGKEDVKVEGSQAGIDSFKAAVTELIGEFEASAAERALRNFQVAVESVSVEAIGEMSRELISAKPGQQRKIEMWRDEYNVNIQLPKRGSDELTITVTGAEADAVTVATMISKKLRVYETTKTIVVDVDMRCKPMIIGPGGENIQKLQKKYNCRINMPREKGAKLTIQGGEDDCEACKDAILEIAEEFGQEQMERWEEDAYVRPRFEDGDYDYDRQRREQQANEKKKKKAANFNVSGAPWEGGAFPGLGEKKAKTTGGVWGVNK